MLLLLMCAMVDFGMLLNGQAVVTNGARDGARAASLGKSFAQVAGVSGIGTVITNETKALPNGSGVTWEVCTAADIYATTWACSPSSSPSDTKYDAARKNGSIVRVTVKYPYTWITPLPTWIGQKATTPVTQVSYMRIENAK